MIRLRALAVAMATSLALVSCGIRDDSSPRLILDDNTLTGADANGARTGSGDQTSAKVYLLSPQTPTLLRGVRRDASASVSELVDSLLLGLTTEDQNNRLRTAIPARVQLLEVPTINNSVAVINLDDSIFDATGTALLDALAQLVFTASEAPGVSGVRILVEGVPQEWPTGDGSLSGSTLTVYDYPERNPTTQPAFPSALPGAEDAAV